jgi:hypothetical protein
VNTGENCEQTGFAGLGQANDGGFHEELSVVSCQLSVVSHQLRELITEN